MGKKEDKSLPEILEEEKLFNLPKAWNWVRLGSVCEYIQRGKSPEYSTIEKYPVISQKCIQWSGFSIEKVRFINPTTISKYSIERFLIDGDLLWNSTGIGTIGRIAIYEEDKNPYRKAVADGHVTIVRAIKEYINYKYLFYWLASDNIQMNIENNADGSTNQIELSTKTIKEFLVPLPPLSHQQHIIDRIESLFEKLDMAKEIIQNAIDSFESRRASILHKAFSGELTMKWRKENGVGVESWNEMKIGDCITTLTQGWSPKCENFPSTNENDWGVIKTTAIQHLYFDEIENKKLPNNLQPKIQHELKDGDILITRAGPRIRVGVCCLVKRIRPKLILCDKAYRFRAIPDKISSEFLVMLLNTSEKLEEIDKMKTGISESGVNLTQNGFIGMKIKVPTIKEQKEVVKILSYLFEKEDKAKELFNLIENIDNMRKSILAKAFHGELT